MNNEVEQVLKEFKKLGYEWNIDDTTITIRNYIHTTIIINLLNKNYLCAGNDCLSFQVICFDEHQLLTKLFKALGWYDE